MHMAIDEDPKGKGEKEELPEKDAVPEPLAASFTDAFCVLAGVTKTPAAPIAPRTTQPVEAVQVVSIEQAQARAALQTPAPTVKEVTTVHAGVRVRPAAAPPPIPADARNTAQFRGLPAPTAAELRIAREVTAVASPMFERFPEDGPPEKASPAADAATLAGTPDLGDVVDFPGSPTQIGSGASPNSEVSGEIDPLDHEQTGVWHGMPGLNGDENAWMAEGEALPPSEGNEANWTSRFFDKFSSALHGARGAMQTLGKGIVAALQSASQKIAEAYGEMREFFRGLREEGRRKIGQLGAQIDAARRARQIRLPEPTEPKTVVTPYIPPEPWWRNPIIWAVGGGGAFAAGVFAINARVSEIRRGKELAESVGGSQVSAPAQLPEVVHAQTPKVPTLGPSAAPPERPMPKSAVLPQPAKPQPKAPLQPKPEPAAVPPPPKAAASEKSPPRTINLDCAVQGGIPACCLPDDTSGACKPMDLNMKRDDREPARTAGSIRGKLSVTLQGLRAEFVSRNPVEFRPGETSKPLGRIEFVERGK